MRVLATRCRALGLKVEEAGDGFLASTNIFLRGEHGHPPDLIILDIGMPGEDGLSICEELLLDETTAAVPVIVLSGRTDRATLAHCSELGVHYVRKAGDVWPQLKPLICKLLGLEVELSCNGSNESGTSQSDACDELAGTPRSCASTTITSSPRCSKYGSTRRGSRSFAPFNGRDGFWQAITERPQVILTDYAMPNGRGSFLLRRLKGHPLTAHIPVIVITGRDIMACPSGKSGSSLKRRLEKMGAAQVLSKPLEYDQLMLELSRFIAIDGVPVNSERARECLESI